MNWDDFKTAFKALVVALTALPPEMVVWADEPKPYCDATNATIVNLDILADRQMGIPEESHRNEGDLLIPVWSTPRISTVSIRVESLRNDGAGFALKWATLITDRIWWDSNHQRLVDAGMALVDFTDPRKLPDYQVDGRLYSAVNLDMRITWALIEDDDEYDGAWIETATVSGDIA